MEHQAISETHGEEVGRCLPRSCLLGETAVMLVEDTVDVVGLEGESGEMLEGEPHGYFYRMLRSCVSMK